MPSCRLPSAAMSTSARSRQRDNVLRELVESEKAHVADLELVETNFLLPLKARVKDVALLSNVSSNLSMIRSFNLVLLDELVKTDASVGKTFCRLADFSMTHVAHMLGSKGESSSLKL